MVTVCTMCGHYAVKPGEELAGARTMIKRLRDRLKERPVAVDVSQLVLEVELLASEVRQSKARLLSAAA